MSKWLVGSVIGLVLYGAFIAICFYMEAEARSRFEVPSKADIEAIDDRVERVRAETARGHALVDMRVWGPYSIYSTALGVIVLGGSALATILGAIVIWRGARRNTTRKAGLIVTGVLLVALASLFLLGWPPLVAERRIEAQPTTFLETPPHRDSGQLNPS